jgi:hypothetical protein
MTTNNASALDRERIKLIVSALSFAQDGCASHMTRRYDKQLKPLLTAWQEASRNGFCLGWLVRELYDDTDIVTLLGQLNAERREQDEPDEEPDEDGNNSEESGDDFDREDWRRKAYARTRKQRPATSRR